MKLRHIEVFHAVYITGSVSGAARALSVSQPTISKILRYAEDQLGFELFEREGGRLSPTEKGIKLFDKIEPLFETMNELTRYTRRLAEEKSGHLRFAMTPAFGLEVAPSAIADFSKANPNVTLEAETLHANQLVKAMLNNETDIGLVFDAPKSPGLKSDTIGKTHFVCVTPKNASLEIGRTLHVENLNKLPLITLNSKSILGQVLNRKIADTFKSPINSPITVETYHLAKRLVKQGAGIAIIDAITAYSGDMANLEFHNLEDMPTINVDILTRLNDPTVKIREDFKLALRHSLSIINAKTDQKALKLN